MWVKYEEEEAAKSDFVPFLWVRPFSLLSPHLFFTPPKDKDTKTRLARLLQPARLLSSLHPSLSALDMTPPVYSSRHRDEIQHHHWHIFRLALPFHLLGTEITKASSGICILAFGETLPSPPCLSLSMWARSGGERRLKDRRHRRRRPPTQPSVLKRRKFKRGGGNGLIKVWATVEVREDRHLQQLKFSRILSHL